MAQPFLSPVFLGTGWMKIELLLVQVQECGVVLLQYAIKVRKTAYKIFFHLLNLSVNLRILPSTKWESIYLFPIIMKINAIHILLIAVLSSIKVKNISISLCVLCVNISAVTCNSVTLPNGQVSPMMETYPYGTRITFSCNNGYRLDTSGHQSASSARCSDTGMWSHNTPECDRSKTIFIHIKYPTFCFP